MDLRAYILLPNGLQCKASAARLNQVGLNARTCIAGKVPSRASYNDFTTPRMNCSSYLMHLHIDMCLLFAWRTMCA